MCKKSNDYKCTIMLRFGYGKPQEVPIAEVPKLLLKITLKFLFFVLLVVLFSFILGIFKIY